MKARRFGRQAFVAALLAAGLITAGFVRPAHAATAPSVIKIGTLYASTGTFEVTSQGQYEGLKYWAAQVNKAGGIFVKAYNKKIPVKIVAYDDQSSTSTATTLYNQLITQDKVDVLVADFGSVLTSVAIPLAEEHHMLLLDPTGSGANFFQKKTNYLADISIPSSQVWPIPLGQFILSKKIKNVAILYDSNDFNASQAETLKSTLGKGGVTPVYYNAVPTDTSNYAVLLHTIAATKPDAVIEFGYNPNDIAFLRDYASSGLHFNMLFTIFPGQLYNLIAKNVGAKALNYTYTYPTPPLVSYKTTSLGPATAAFIKEWSAAYGNAAPNFLNCAGYNNGLIIQEMLARAPQFTQEDFHQALMDISGNTRTLLGDFRINENGAQLGEFFPVAQLVPQGDGNKFVVVYPQEQATGSAVYPAPH